MILIILTNRLSKLSVNFINKDYNWLIEKIKNTDINIIHIVYDNNNYIYKYIKGHDIKFNSNIELLLETLVSNTPQFILIKGNFYYIVKYNDNINNVYNNIIEHNFISKY